MQILRATSVGQIAHQILLAVPEGVVLAAVSNVHYLKTASEELLWIHGPTVARHARGVLIEEPIGTLPVGMQFYVCGAKLTQANRLYIDMGSSAIWDPPVPDLQSLVPLSALPARMVEFNHAYLSIIKEKNSLLGCVLRKNVFFENSTPAKPSGARIQSRSRLQGVLNACRSRDLSCVLPHAQKMIGLGSGLTPSGDDFIGGLMFVLDCLGYLYNLENLNGGEEIDKLLSFASVSTNLISYTLLSDLASGSGVEPLHHFVYSLLSHVPIENCIQHARQLEEIGSSTGQALIAGIIAGIEMAFPARALQNQGGKVICR